MVSMLLCPSTSASRTTSWAEGLHAGPDRLPGNGETVLGEKNLARGDFLLFGVLLQLPAEPMVEQDGADFALQGDLRHPGPYRLHGDVL